MMYGGLSVAARLSRLAQMISTPRCRISGTPSSRSTGERAKRTTSSTGAIACGRGLDAVEHDGEVEVPLHR
jgi:hypothetical protein